MALHRVFLGRDEPALQRAAAWLAARGAGGAGGVLDLGRVLVVTPGGRAGRRLVEILASGAPGLVPPSTVTVGHLPERLYRPARQVANPLASLLAWVEALGATPAREVRAFARPPGDDDARLRLAAELADLWEALAAGPVAFADVPARAKAAGLRLPAGEDDRWAALARVHARYREAIARAGLVDLHDAREAALASGGVDPGETIGEIVLVGAWDMPPVVRRFVLEAARRCEVHALVPAPEDESDRFDEVGCVAVDRWADAAVDLAGADLVFADRPRDCAAAVVEALRADHRTKTFAPDEVTVGLGDESLAPSVVRALAWAGAPARGATGTPLVETRPGILLQALAAHLARGDVETFAALVRHPDLAAWIDARREGSTRPLAEALDAWRAEAIPHTLGDWPGEGAGEVREAYRIFEGLLEGTDGRRPVASWAGAVAAILRAVYASVDVQDDREDLEDALGRIGDALREAAAIPDPLGGSTDLAGFLRLLLRRLEGEAIPPHGGPPAVEVVGWLEVPLDDAPRLVLVHANEGSIPAGRGADPFLPDRLRAALGLPTSRSIAARDAAGLALALAARTRATVIVGRRDADGSALLPSRFLLSGDPVVAAERLERHLADPPPAAPLLRAGVEDRVALPYPEPPEPPIDRLAVTAFRDYLACPYRFYLRHVLRLEDVTDDAVEMDGLAFGVLAHEVLAAFAQMPEASSTDPAAVRRALRAALDAAVRARFGRAPSPTVGLQVRMLRGRLDRLAAWQAAEAAAGWRIVRSEVRVDAEIDVDGAPFKIVGKIDRIDRNETGAWRILDYKTGKGTPEETHREGAAAGRWIDLQLPLYRLLARYVGAPPDAALGYVLLPAETPRGVLAEATWSNAEHAEALEEARRVIRAVRAGRFWPPADPATLRYPDDGLDSICMDRFIDRAGAIRRAAP